MNTWSASMITPAVEIATAPIFRRVFTLDEGHGEVRAAVLRISSLGVYEALVNGVEVSEDVLSPGWTAYEWRLRYQSYEVARMLDQTTVLTVRIGNGWYRGGLGSMSNRSVYGHELGLIAQLDIDFADGHRQTVVTDGGWSAGPSDVLANDLYDGQTIDARRRHALSTLADDVDEETRRALGAFADVRILDFATGRLVPSASPPIRRQERVRPVRVWESPSGRTLVDFGQNLVGWVRFSVSGPRGSEIRIRHAEVLEDHELATRPLRNAQATDRFILSGGDDSFEPTMTFHGFRYIEVSGWPGALTLDDVEAVVVHSDLVRTGTFRCSDPLLDRLHENVAWGTRGNFVSLPTDCPQRDERLGWTGDIAVFAPSAAFLFDVEHFLGDWLVDLALEQSHNDGIVPYVVPDVLKRLPAAPGLSTPDSTAIWGDAAVWVPWVLYQAYGDPAVLARQYDSMTAHLRRIETLLSPSGLWESSFQFGDWLDPNAPPHEPGRSKADSGVVATACLFRTASIVADTATELGHLEDAAAFRSLAERTRTAFNRTYVGEHGWIRSDCATVYSLAIAFGLLDEKTQHAAGTRLSAIVAQSGYRITTGFAGTPYILDALTLTDHLDDAYALLMQTECPSWLYPVTMGATTVWERWDSMLPDGRVNPGEMTSFNHYALGAVADWMHRHVGGLVVTRPGYESVRIAPRPGGGVTWAEVGLKTRAGDLRVAWRLGDAQLTLEVHAPSGIDAVLSIAGREDIRLPTGASVHTFKA